MVPDRCREGGDGEQTALCVQKSDKSYQVDMVNELYMEYFVACHELDVDSLVIEAGFDRLGKNEDLPELNMNNALSTVSSSLCSGSCAPSLFLAVLIGFFCSEGYEADVGQRFNF